MGVIISGPVWGRITDSRGPRIPLASAFLLLFVGYSGIRHIYDQGLPTPESSLPVLSLYTLMVCNFMTGTAANAGLNGSVNPTAKTFPDRMVRTCHMIRNTSWTYTEWAISEGYSNWSGSIRIWPFGLFLL